MAGQRPVTKEMMTDEFIQNQLRAIFEGMKEAQNGPEFDAYKFNFENIEVELGGTQYHENAEKQKCLIQRVEGVNGHIKPTLVYFHGGGAVGGDYSQMIPINNRVAKAADATVISCNFGLAPERAAPRGIEDAYACLKDIIDNHKEYKVNPNKIMIFGESGGAYIVAGVGMMLAQRKESDLVKLQFL